MKCDIIIPVWNQLVFTKRCIESIRKNTRFPYRLILVDNASDDETREYLEGLAQGAGDVTLIRNGENLGFIKAVNQGLRASTSGYICLMNNDTVAADRWLSRMVLAAESAEHIGLVNPRSEAPGRFSIDEYATRLAEKKGAYIETNQCMGFCMLVKREVLEAVGYLDEAYGMGGFDDTDFSKRADLAGYRCVCAGDAYVYHDWHTSFKKAGNREGLVRTNEEIFFSKWGKYLRIGYPITFGGSDAFESDMNLSLGLAREWNWVHAWLSTGGALKASMRSLDLPRHQSLRLFKMSGLRPLFYMEVLFKLIERRLKGRKLFDAVLVSDRGLFIFLTTFKNLFSTPVFFVEPVPARGGKEGSEAWRKRAKEIAEAVKKEKA